MFAASPQKIRKYEEAGSCGNSSLDYAIGLLLKLERGDYSTSEIAVLETVSVASRLGGLNKAEILFEAVMTQQGLRILETRALAYPIAFTFVLMHQLEARDSLHLAIAALNAVSGLITSDKDFADGTAVIIKKVADRGFQMPPLVRVFYGLTDKEAALIEERVAQSLSLVSLERAPT